MWLHDCSESPAGPQSKQQMSAIFNDVQTFMEETLHPQNLLSSTRSDSSAIPLISLEKGDYISTGLFLLLYTLHLLGLVNPLCLHLM